MVTSRRSFWQNGSLEIRVSSFLDEPTRGIDVGARSSIYDLIVDLAEQGVAVIVVSSDLEEVLGVSSRILVMSHGRQTGILDRADANDVSVMELATS